MMQQLYGQPYLFKVVKFTVTTLFCISFVHCWKVQHPQGSNNEKLAGFSVSLPS